MAASLVEIKDLCISFGHNAVVKHANLKIRKGEMVALVGESGSGKSVTALSILQLLQGAEQSGSIRFHGEELMNQKEAVLRKVRGAKAGIVFQEPMTSLNPLHRIGDQIAEIIRTHNDVSRSEARSRVQALFEEMGFKRLAKRLDAYPHELSGGQRQRVMIAMAIANNPELLIADEPTTALDVIVAAQILKILKKIQRKMKMAILLITHDLTIVEKMADRVYVMRNGDIVEDGKTSDIFTRPSNVYTRHLINSSPKGVAVRHAANEVNTKNHLVEAKNLSVSFPIKGGLFGRQTGTIDAVKNAGIIVPEGKTIGIVGESGSGKTTLGMAILGLSRSKTSGEIFFCGNRIDNLALKSMRPLRHEMQVVFQDPYASLNPRMTVGQIISEGPRAHSIPVDVEKVLGEVGLSAEMANRYPHEFSGGQRQRIGIARAIALNPKFILLDEPTSALDLSVQTQIIDLLKKLQKERKISYIFISHDLRVMKAIAHEIAVMKEGEIIEYGTTRRIFDHPANDYTKELIKAAFPA